MGFPWFVFVFAAFPTLFTFVHNYPGASAGDTIAPLLLGLATAGLLLGLLFLVRRDWRSAGVAAAVIIGWFFTFQFQWMVIQQLPVFPSKFQAVPITGALALLLAGFVLWRPAPSEKVVAPLNTFALMLLALSAANLAVKAVGVPEPDIPTVDWPGAPAEAPEPTSARDVYYVVLDGYARADVLREVYGYDNAPFIQRLEERGFHVFDDARANYVHTGLSLASTLNGTYLDELEPRLRGLDERAAAVVPFEMIHRNVVMDFVRRQDYTVYNLRSSWGPTEALQAADVNLGCGLSNSGREFYTVLLSYTPAWPLQGEIPRLRDDYSGRRCILDKLLGVHEEPGPKFVMAHLLLPHPPVVFGPDGQPADAEPTLLGDNNAWADKDGYLGQLTYINQVVLGLVDELLTGGSPDPIIVLQSDHGPASIGVANSSPALIRERSTILHALYLPGAVSVPHEKLTTPVNTFRYILAEYFGAPATLLPNHTFFSPFDDKFGFVRVDSLWGE